MFRNNIGSRTQNIQNTTNTTNILNTTNPPNLFTGNYNTLGNNNTTCNNQSKHDDDIIFAIVTCNLTLLRRLVNSSNVNNVIDKKNKYTVLHHAVRIKKNDQIVEYLLSCGANPTILQDECKDCVDLSIEANYRFLIDKLLKDKDRELDNLYNKYDDFNYKIKNLERTNVELTKTNDYLTKSNSEYVEKIESLKNENSNLKRKFDESEKAFNNLLKKIRK